MDTNITSATLAIQLLLAAFLLPGCAASSTIDAPAPGPEATSLLGEPLEPMALDPDVRAEREALLEDARAAWRAAPDDVDAIIWYGRRTAYLGRYRAAIDIYTEGLGRHPDSPRFLRHRGHRYITLRRLGEAITDLERAAAVAEGTPDAPEADGLPNERGIPTSTTQGNILYHLGLARYLKGDFEGAAAAYDRGLDLAHTDDMYCATSYWLYLALRRSGRERASAAVLGAIGPGMDIIENTSYHQLLLLFKGVTTQHEIVAGESIVGVAVDDATIGYGIGAWHRLRGRPDEARAAFSAVVDGEAWPAFGHIAAEAELARVGW